MSKANTVKKQYIDKNKNLWEWEESKELLQALKEYERIKASNS